jgi:hypothetical protein
MARHAVDRPHWQHSNGHRYDEIDFGFTRFVDAADAAADELRGNRRRRISSTLRQLFHFRHPTVTDTTRNSR